MLRETILEKWKTCKEKVKNQLQIILRYPDKGKKTVLLRDIRAWLLTNYESGKDGLTDLEKQRAKIIEPYLKETDYQQLRKLEKELGAFLNKIWNVAAWVRENKILWRLAFLLDTWALIKDEDEYKPRIKWN